MKLNNQKLNKGFTLIELLVVISIIALLMSIMMPALGRARDAARKTICTSNCKNVGLGATMFTNENNGYLPMYSGSRNKAGGYDNFPHRDIWVYDIAPYLGYENEPYANAITESLGGSVAKAELDGIDAPKVLACPALKVRAAVAQINESGGNVEINAKKVLSLGWNWRGMGYVYKNFDTNWWFPRKADEIKTPSKTAIAGENRIHANAARIAWGGEMPGSNSGGGFGGGGSGSASGSEYYYGRRHSDGGAYICVDGHVEFETYDNLVEDWRNGGVITMPKPVKNQKIR